MAQVTSKRNNSVPSINKSVRHIRKTFSVANADAANGDNIEVFKVPVGQPGFLHRLVVRQSASLGAGATLAGSVFDGVSTHTVLTPATTAGAASQVASDADSDVPLALNGGETIELAVAGAGITASATITVDVYISA